MGRGLISYFCQVTMCTITMYFFPLNWLSVVLFLCINIYLVDNHKNQNMSKENGGAEGFSCHTQCFSIVAAQDLPDCNLLFLSAVIGLDCVKIAIIMAKMFSVIFLKDKTRSECLPSLKFILTKHLENPRRAIWRKIIFWEDSSRERTVNA